MAACTDLQPRRPIHGCAHRFRRRPRVAPGSALHRRESSVSARRAARNRGLHGSSQVLARALLRVLRKGFLAIIDRVRCVSRCTGVRERCRTRTDDGRCRVTAIGTGSRRHAAILTTAHIAATHRHRSENGHRDPHRDLCDVAMKNRAECAFHCASRHHATVCAHHQSPVPVPHSLAPMSVRYSRCSTSSGDNASTMR